MWKKRMTLMLILFLLFERSGWAQSLVGFWKVNEVVVGTVDRTPVAKWMRINQDGTYQSGNGGIQNSEGTWTFDSRAKLYLPVDTIGVKDPYGGFRVTFDNKQMVWEREEDGEHVAVRLERTTKAPKSHADLLVGLWDLTEVVKGNSSVKSTFDPEDLHYIFIRWDRIYVERTPDGKKLTGYWHMNAHRPEMSFLCDGEGKLKESWTVDVTEVRLQMIGISDANKGIQRVYRRIREFPK